MACKFPIKILYSVNEISNLQCAAGKVTINFLGSLFLPKGRG